MYTVYRAADGASWRYWESWYDTARDEPCWVQRMSDGKLHCAPSGEEPTFTPDTSFADAACTMPIIGVGTWHNDPQQCIDPPVAGAQRYFRLTSRSDICAPTRLVAFPKTSPLVLSNYYAKMPDGTCQKGPSLTGGTFEIYAAQLPLVEVSASSFALIDAKDATPVTASRLRVARTEYTGEDGAKSVSPGRILDGARDEFCNPRTAADGTRRCMPYAGGVEAEDYADPQCTQGAFTVANNGNCPADDARYTFWSYMEQEDYSACYEVTLYPRFTAGQLSTAYYGKPGACTQMDVSNTSGYTFYAAPALPPAIPATEFAPISTTTEDAPISFYGTNGTRLRVQRMVTRGDGGFELASPYYLPFDQKSGTPCGVAMLPDGGVYCVPTYGYFTYDSQRGAPLYADPACTDPVLGVAKGNTNGCGDTAPPLVYAETSFSLGRCQVTRFFHLPSAPIAKPTLYARTSTNTCGLAVVDLTANDFYRRADCVEVQGSELVRVDVSTVH